ncbi:MAG: acyltransferase [Flavipsychrobacter sp.]|nr:acyltransferase [Flavipsychrobacter sp.]
MKHIKGLDTLRAFAVIFVIIEHFGVWFDDTTPAGRFTRCFIIPGGGFGVNLFFVLSGFLITAILLKAKAEPSATPATIIKSFYIRRSLRIFPIYYLLLLLLCFIGYPDVREHFWYFATYTSNLLSYRTNSWNAYSHTWTLAVEEQFYLLWPWLIILLNAKYIRFMLFIAIAIGIVTPLITMHTHPIGPLLVFHSFDAFAIGGLFAWARLNDKHCKQFVRAIKILAIPALCIYFYWRIQVFYEVWFVQLYLIKICNSIIAMWLIILVVNNRSAITEKYLLGNRAINYIGKISYGIYLYHSPYIIYFRDRVNKLMDDHTIHHYRLNNLLKDHHVNYWIHILIMITVAGLSFKLIEAPLLNLKKRFNYNNGNDRPLTTGQNQ